MILSQLYTNKTVFLAGAGVSISPPSNLPSAKSFIEVLFSQMEKRIGYDHFFDEILDSIHNTDCIRFEKVMSVVQELTRRNVHLIEVYGLSESPNFLHCCLASQMELGHIVVTTNFDKLIELACMDLNDGCVRQAVYDADYEHNDDEVTLYKLHGSWEIYRHGKWESSLDSIRATLESVYSQGHAFELSPKKLAFFQGVLNSSDIVVLGYSGSDDFDIVPMICSVDSQHKLIWIEHVEGSSDQRLYQGIECLTCLPEESRARVIFQKIVERRSRNPENLYVIRGSTCGIIKEMTGVTEDVMTSTKGRRKEIKEFAIDLSKYFEEKCRVLDLNLGVAYLLKAKLVQDTGDYEKVVSYTRLAMREFAGDGQDGVASEKDNAIRKMRFSQAGHYYLTLINHIDKAHIPDVIPIAEQLVKIDEEYHPEWIVLSYTALANKYKYFGEIEKSLETHRKAIQEGKRWVRKKQDDASCRQFAIALAAYGTTLQHIGRDMESLEIYKTAIEIMSSLGMIWDVASTKLNIGIVLMDAGHSRVQQGLFGPVREFRQSSEYLQEAKDLFGNLHDLDGVGRSLHEFGILANKMQRFSEAIHYFKECIETMRRIGNREGIAKAKKEMAVALFQMDRCEESESCLDESDEILKDIGRSYFYAHNLQLRGMLRFKERDFGGAKMLLEESIAISTQEGDQRNVENCRILLNTLKAMGVSSHE